MCVLRSIGPAIIHLTAQTGKASRATTTIPKGLLNKMKTVQSVTVALLASLSLATDILTPEKIEAEINTVDLQRNLWNLNHIANKNGGNRAFGLPGYKASSDYVLERVQKRFGKEFDTYLQYFNHTFEQTRKISVTGPGGEDVLVRTLLYNTATPLPGGITATLIDTPVDDARGSGCFEDQWTGIDATGKLALVKRGSCAIAEKLKLARAHGALGVVLYTNAPGIPTSATLGADNIGLLVPVAVIQQDVGVAWKARLTAGEKLTVNLLVDSIFEQRERWNIISETKAGDPNNVVFLGAHLDSVQAGPGVNDDGSGTSALLEIATAFRHYKSFPNKVRFAWWGAEESGLIGSLHYTSTLSENEADKIRFYFNYDMIGSPFPTYAVYKNDGQGGDLGAQALLDYLVAAGKPANYGGFGTGSDYVGFLQLGIPSSGLFTGAGAPTDPCYHLACDTTDNINVEALTLNSKAAGHVAAKFALSLAGVPARSKVSVNPRSRTRIRNELAKWGVTAVDAAHAQSCSHNSNNVV